MLPTGQLANKPDKINQGTLIAKSSSGAVAENTNPDNDTNAKEEKNEKINDQNQIEANKSGKAEQMPFEKASLEVGKKSKREENKENDDEHLQLRVNKQVSNRKKL